MSKICSPQLYVCEVWTPPTWRFMESDSSLRGNDQFTRIYQVIEIVNKNGRSGSIYFYSKRKKIESIAKKGLEICREDYILRLGVPSPSKF